MPFGLFVALWCALSFTCCELSFAMIMGPQLRAFIVVVVVVVIVAEVVAIVFIIIVIVINCYYILLF